MITTLVSKKVANFVAENWRTSPKYIVFVTLNPSLKTLISINTHRSKKIPSSLPN
jgi:hypothetical protein